MRFNKPFALTLATVAALLLLTVAVPWLGSRTGLARRAAGDYLGEATGLPVTVGSLAIAFLPTPSLVLGAVAIAQPPGFGADPLLEVSEARVAVPWSTLFGGDPVLRSVTISDATARPALAPDGADNWSALIQRLSELGGQGDSDWSIGRLDIERGALEFRDATTDSGWRLTAIGVGAQAIAPVMEFPVELQLAGVTASNTFHFAFRGQALLDPDAGRYSAHGLTLRGWIGGGPLPLAGLDFEGGIAAASFDSEKNVAAVSGGTMTIVGIRGEGGLDFNGADGENRLDFSLKTGPFAPRRAAIAFGYPLPATTDPQAFGTMQFSLKGRLREGRLLLDPIEGRLDDTQWSGHAIPQERLIRIQADRLDLDRYLAPDQETGKDKKATLEAVVAQFGELDIDAEIRIAEARVAGAKLRDAVLTIERDAAATP
jgi:AsmA protein